MTTYHGFNTDELDLREGEVIVSVMRKHWFVLFREVIGFKFIFFIPLIIAAGMSSLGLSEADIAVLVFFSALWMLVLLMIIFTIWTNYYLDLWIVTNQRLIDIEQKHLFNREIMTLRMETVQDVQVDVVGIFETFLKFGTLRVQTAGRGDTDAKIIGIPRPEIERDIIMQQVHMINRRNEAAAKGARSPFPHTV